MLYSTKEKSSFTKTVYTFTKQNPFPKKSPLTIPNWNNWMSVIPDRRKIVDTGRAIFLEVKQAWR